MPVIAMKVPCTIALPVPTDVYGTPTFGPARPARCAIVKLLKQAKHTTVRADSGATRGHADETIAEAVLLLSNKIEPEIDSAVVVRGIALRVISVRHRTDVSGKLDHYEIGCSIE